MKTVSFVMPVYNPPEDRFRRMLRSILDQRDVRVELVAVDDGSTNGALGILREFEAAHPGTVKVRSRENRGAGPSRNEGVLLATGDYVWFVDADDLVRPGAAARLAGVLDETGAEMVTFDVLYAYPPREPPFPEEWTGTVRETSPKAEIAEKRNAAWSRLCRRDFLGRVGVRFCDAKTGEDIVEAFRWVLEASRVVRLDEPCYLYVLRDGSAVRSPPDVCFFEKGWQVADLFDDLARRFPDCAPWLELWNFVRTRGHIRLADRYLENPEGRSAEDLEAVRRAREEYLVRFGKMDAGNPLVALHDTVRLRERRDVGERWKEKLRQSDGERKRAETKSSALENGLADAKRALEARTRALEKTERALETAARALEKTERALEKAKRSSERKSCALEAKERELEAIRNSLSWRVTAPIRGLLKPLSRHRGGNGSV